MHTYLIDRYVELFPPKFCIFHFCDLGNAFDIHALIGYLALREAERGGGGNVKEALRAGGQVMGGRLAI